MVGNLCMYGLSSPGPLWPGAPFFLLWLAPLPPVSPVITPPAPPITALAVCGRSDYRRPKEKKRGNTGGTTKIGLYGPRNNGERNIAKKESQYLELEYTDIYISQKPRVGDGCSWFEMVAGLAWWLAGASGGFTAGMWAASGAGIYSVCHKKRRPLMYVVQRPVSQGHASSIYASCTACLVSFCQLQAAFKSIKGLLFS